MEKLNVSLLGNDEIPSAKAKENYFRHCYEVLYVDVFGMAYQYFGNQEDAEDLTAEFFEKLMAWSISKFRGKENLEGYIRRAARNFIIDKMN